MQAAQALSGEAILAIPLDEPERLFGPEPGRLSKVFRTLAKRWHPDASAAPRSAEVFDHISVLRGEAATRAAKGAWRRPGVVRFESVDGRAYDVAFRRKHAFELGEIYVSPTALTYALDNEVSDLAAAADGAIARLAFRGAEMERMFKGRMPRLRKRFATRDRNVFVFEKTPDQILLKDLLAHVGGRLDPRHVAWIVSDLESEVAYMDLPFVGVVHPALGPDTLLVSPKYHTVTVAGGWWYAARSGEKFPGAPDRTVDNVPPVVLRPDKADVRVALETVRLTAAECLGFPNPTMALRDGKIPLPFRQWLAGGPATSGAADYEAWATAREASFGPRKFVELSVDPDRVYPPTPN